MSRSERYPRDTSRRSGLWPISCVLIVLIGVAGFLFYHYSPVRAAGSAASQVMEGAKDLVREFTRENITTTFRSKLISLADTKGGRLEVAELESIEEFRRESSSRLFGTTISEARATAVFKFHVPLRDGWQIDVEEAENIRACRVIAPALRPSLPVAFRSDELETRSSEGWLRWDEEEEMSTLLGQITPELERRAHKNVDVARETARKTIKEFVQTWLLENDQWRDDRFSIVEVQFSDEVPDAEREAEVTPAVTATALP